MFGLLTNVFCLEKCLQGFDRACNISRLAMFKDKNMVRLNGNKICWTSFVMRYLGFGKLSSYFRGPIIIKKTKSNHRIDLQKFGHLYSFAINTLQPYYPDLTDFLSQISIDEYIYANTINNNIAVFWRQNGHRFVFFYHFCVSALFRLIRRVVLILFTKCQARVFWSLQEEVKCLLIISPSPLIIGNPAVAHRPPFWPHGRFSVLSFSVQSVLSFVSVL